MSNKITPHQPPLPTSKPQTPLPTLATSPPPPHQVSLQFIYHIKIWNWMCDSSLEWDFFAPFITIHAFLSSGRELL
jgi:hypothetical protein